MVVQPQRPATALPSTQECPPRSPAPCQVVPYCTSALSPATGRPVCSTIHLGRRHDSLGWQVPQEGVSAPAAANWVTAKMPQCHPFARLAQLSADLPKILLGPKQTVITHHDQAVTLEKSLCTLTLLKLSPYHTSLHRSGVLPSALQEMCCRGPGCQGFIVTLGKGMEGS